MVDAEQVSAWKDGYLIFKNASFEEVTAALERKYNVTINYNAEKYKGRTYYVKFNPDESIEDALLILKHLIEDFRYRITGQTTTAYIKERRGERPAKSPPRILKS